MNRSNHHKALTVEEVTALMLETYQRLELLGHTILGQKPRTDQEARDRGDYGVLRCTLCHRVAFVEMEPSTARGYVWGDALDKGRCPRRKVRSVELTFREYGE